MKRRSFLKNAAFLTAAASAAPVLAGCRREETGGEDSRLSVARNFRYGPDGRPLNVPRHPILEDGVTVYSNTSILGRVTIGEGSVIGGNVWLTHSVPPHSTIVQGRAQESFTDGAGI